MRKSNISVHDILFRTAGVLLILTLLSVWMLCGMYAKYTVSGSHADSARAAAFGNIVLLEHKAVPNDTNDINTLYILTNEEVKENTYSTVVPGDVIPKDPFVRITNVGEVKCELYLKVTESENFPDGVEYDLNEKWILVDGKEDDKEKVYKYKDPITPGSNNMDIYILKDDNLIVNVGYNSTDTFTLTFSAWLKQAK